MAFRMSRARRGISYNAVKSLVRLAKRAPRPRGKKSVWLWVLLGLGAAAAIFHKQLKALFNK